MTTPGEVKTPGEVEASKTLKELIRESHERKIRKHCEKLKREYLYPITDDQIKYIDGVVLKYCNEISIWDVDNSQYYFPIFVLITEVIHYCNTEEPRSSFLKISVSNFDDSVRSVASNGGNKLFITLDDIYNRNRKSRNIEEHAYSLMNIIRCVNVSSEFDRLVKLILTEMLKDRVHSAELGYSCSVRAVKFTLI